MTSNEVETVIENFPTKKSPIPDGLTAEFYQTLKLELTRMLLQLL
jgi:hypothetical protein